MKKVTVIKTAKWVLDPTERVKLLKEGESYNLPDNQASRLLETGYAVKFGAKIPKAKPDQPTVENKMVDTSSTKK